MKLKLNEIKQKFYEFDFVLSKICSWEWMKKNNIHCEIAAG